MSDAVAPPVAPASIQTVTSVSVAASTMSTGRVPICRNRRLYNLLLRCREISNARWRSRERRHCIDQLLDLCGRQRGAIAELEMIELVAGAGVPALQRRAVAAAEYADDEVVAAAREPHLIFRDAGAEHDPVGAKIGIAVRDGVDAAAAAEQVGVRALPAHQGVVAGAAVEDVVAKTAAQDVACAVADELVAAGVARAVDR